MEVQVMTLQLILSDLLRSFQVGYRSLFTRTRVPVTRSVN